MPDWLLCHALDFVSPKESDGQKDVLKMSREEVDHGMLGYLREHTSGHLQQEIGTLLQSSPSECKHHSILSIIFTTNIILGWD